MWSLHYDAEENVRHAVDRLDWRRAHEKIYYSTDFQENKLRRSDVVEDVDDRAEINDHGQHLKQ